MLNPGLFKFLIELKSSNTKEWFAANKKRFENEVREPLLGFIEAFAPHLEEISPYFLAIASRSGGSMFRIHRDVRFSSDKSPYKTNAGLHFRHENGKDAHCPGFYLHLEPGKCFCGAGIWRPDSASLKAVRDLILERPDQWKKVSRSPHFSLGGDSLKRPPRGYDKDHPLIDDLKRKDMVAFVDLSDEEVVGDDFLEQYVDHCRRFAPFVKFISEAVEQPF